MKRKSESKPVNFRITAHSRSHFILSAVVSMTLHSVAFHSITVSPASLGSVCNPLIILGSHTIARNGFLDEKPPDR